MTADDIVDLLLEVESFDPLMRELTHAVTQEPWVKAQQAWDAVVTAGYGDNPWWAVLVALGYPSSSEPMRDLADDINNYFEQAQCESEGGVSVDEGWTNFVLPILDDLPPEHVDAIKRIWYRQLG